MSHIRAKLDVTDTSESIMNYGESADTCKQPDLPDNLVTIFL